jgi:hypothetical protein
MYQPSVNQIANLYQGNPQALQQRVAQEPKGPTGLPMDLSKLMALNINLTEVDAAKRQAALSGLQQMQQQSPTGEPPTVAQQVEQAAMQKAAQMQQMQPQMQAPAQGLQALAQGMAGAPQQAGLDMLGSNLGEHYASGGIIAFKEGDEVEDPEVKKKLEQYTLAQQGADWEARRQAARDEEDKKTSTAGDVGRGLAALAQRIASPIGAAFENLTERQKLRQEMEKNRPGFFEALSPEERAARQEKSKDLLGQLNKVIESKPMDKSRPASEASAVPLDDESRKLMRLAAAQSQTGINTNPDLIPRKQITGPSPENAAPRPGATGLAAIAAPAAAPAAPAEKSLYDKFLEQSLAKTPEARRDEALARYKETIGAPDTSAQEKYIQQLEASRSRFAESEDPVERARAYFRDLANAGGRHWYETGSKASANAEARRQGNAQKDIETLKELMAESAKVADTKRGYKKEAFAFGEKEYDDAFKNGMDAAKEMGLAGRQAQLFAHQSAENALQRKNAIAVAGMKGSEERLFDKIASDWLKKPENEGKSLSDAYAAFKLTGQGYRPEQARAGLIEKYSNDWNKMDYVEKSNFKKDGINNSEDYIKYMMRVTEQNKPGAAAQANAPISKAQYDALPKGATYTAPDGSQRVKG